MCDLPVLSVSLNNTNLLSLPFEEITTNHNRSSQTHSDVQVSIVGLFLRLNGCNLTLRLLYFRLLLGFLLFLL